MGRMTSHMKWKIKVMFETTNQHWLIIIFPIKSTIVGAFISHVLPQFQTTTAPPKPLQRTGISSMDHDGSIFPSLVGAPYPNLWGLYI